MNPAPPGAFTLDYGGGSVLSSDDATASTTGLGVPLYPWTMITDPSWSTGDTVEVKIALLETEATEVEPITLVSNTGQGGDENAAWSDDRAQSFTTASNSAGYTLSSIEIISEDTQSDDAAVAVWTVDSDGFPDSLHASLTAPSSFAAGTLVFTAPADTTLAASTTYTVVVQSPGGETLTLDATSENGEDAGGAAGWTIADRYQFKNLSNNWTTAGSGDALRTAVKGTVVPGGETCNATWYATMTVGEFTNSSGDEYVGYDDATILDSAFGLLTSTSVEISSVTYTVHSLGYDTATESCS